MSNERTPQAPELEVIKADDLMMISRSTFAAPIAGRPAQATTERGHLVRYGRFLILNVPAVGELSGNVMTVIARDEEAAAVELGNQKDALRRDGWALRDPDPWEIPVINHSPIPF